VFVPAVVPSVQEVSAAIPELLVVTVLPLTGDVVPPPAVTAKVTTTPATPLPFTSRTRTDGGFVTVVPIAALWLLVPALREICVAVPGLPVAVKVSGLPASTPDVAVSVLLPAVVPSTHELKAAMPDAFVTTVLPVGDEIEPPPVATANATLTPATGLLLPSRTKTDGAVATALPAVAV
jgi:hypothetical protein